MRICLLGGTGFVGSRLAARLAGRGHELVIPTRSEPRSRHLLVLPTARVLRADVSNPAALRPALAGCSVAVNLVGILNEHGRSGVGFEAAHTRLTRTLLQEADRAGVGKIVYVSALRADSAAGPSHYLRSKGAAEDAIRQSGRLRWTILQPSVIFGPADSFTNRFGQLLRRIPLVFPLAMPGARFAPVHVDDVVAATTLAVESTATDGRTYQLCGPEVLTLCEIVEFIAAEQGLRRVVLRLPRWASRLQGALMDYVPGKPFSTDNFLSLTVDSVCSESGMAALGLRPRPFRANLAASLSTVITRTHRDSVRQLAGRQGW